MEKYNVDGKIYNVSADRKQDFLLKFPNATLVLLTAKQRHARAETLARESLISSVSDKTNIPKWALPLATRFAGGTADLISGVFEFGEGVIENLEGMSAEEMRKDGLNPISERLTKLADGMEAFYTKEYDAEGNVLDFSTLLEEGDYDNAIGLALEQAFESAPTMIASVINPFWGGALMGISSAGNTFKDDLETRPDETLKNINKNALWAGGSEWAGEYLGGKWFRAMNKFDPSGTNTKVVKELTENYVKRFVGRTMGSSVAEAASETITATMQTAGNEYFYKDQKSTGDYLTNIVNSIGPALLMGGFGGAMSSVSRTDATEVYKYVSPQQWKEKSLKIGYHINQAENDLKNADDKLKPKFQEKIKNLKDQKKKHDQKLVDKFTNMSNKELDDYAKNLDAVNDNLNIINNNSYSEDAQKQARNENTELLKDNLTQLALEGSLDVSVEQSIGEALKASEIIAERLQKAKGINREDLDIKILKSEEEVELAVKEAGRGVKNTDGAFIGENKDGKAVIYINQNVASAASATNVLGHELLHYMISRKFKTDNASMEPLVNELKTYLKDNYSNEYLAVQSRIDKFYTEVVVNADGVRTKRIKDGALEEYLNVFSDLISKKKVELKEAGSKGLMSGLSDVMNGFGFGSIKLDNAQDVVSFLSTYNNSINRKGLLGKLMGTKILDVNLTSTKLTKGKTKINKKSLSTEERVEVTDQVNSMAESYEIQGGNEMWKQFGAQEAQKEMQESGLLDALIYSKYKAENVPPNFVKLVYSELTNHIANYKPENENESGLFGWINSQIRNKANAVYNREFKARPDQKGPSLSDKTKEGAPIIQPIADETPSDFETENVLAGQVREKRGEKKTDTTAKKDKVRELKSLADINIDNTEIISASIQAEINNLIEQNPSNLEQQITNLIDKKIRKYVQEQMGKIENKKGEVVISDEYKAFIAFNYADIVQSLDVATIKKNYNTLFELTEIGKEDKKTKKSDKPSLKKDSNFRKGIYKIETNKAKFTKFFTEGGYTTLLDRQKKLAILITKGYVEDISTNQIIENSTDKEAIAKAKIVEYGRSLNRQKNEVAGNYADQIKFSKNNVADAVFLKRELEEGKTVFNAKGKLLPEYAKKVKKKTGDFVYRELLKDGLIDDYNDILFLTKAFGKLVRAGQRGAKYEQHLIDQAIAIEKKYGKEVIDVVLRKPTETGGKPDLILNIFGEEFNIEAKMTNAQYSSVTFVPEGDSFIIKKDYTFNDQILPLGEKVQKGIKAARAFLKKRYKYDWENIKVIPTKYYEALKKNPVTVDGVEYSSYVNAMSAEMDISLDVVSEIYNKKKDFPVHYIQLMGRGLFSMGENIHGLNVPKLEGDAKLTLRIGSNSQYKTVKGVRSKTGNKVLSWRAIPTIPKKTLDGLQSNHSIGTFAGVEALVKSKEAKMLKASISSKNAMRLNTAVKASRTVGESKGITILDFDDTLATSKSLIRYTKPDGEKGTLTPEEYASTYQDLLGLGYEFDFSEFNKVVDGKVAPLFQKALKLQGKFGPENMFVLTARPAESAPAIFAFLKANGLNIPLKNITGLANSTAEAKALWIADKVGEGYNDFYFADDALQNVQAVDNMLEQFDVKRKVQQAKIKFSESMDIEFNDILENITGIESKKRFDFIKARKRGASKGKFRLFIPPSHEDFVGLLYNFMGKGRKGDQHREFLEQALVRPLNRANKEYDTARQSVATGYRILNKQMPDVKKKLTKKTPDGDFTYQDAIRVYLWDKHGYTIPGLSPIDQKNLVDLVKADSNLQSYAESINTISKQEKYVDPTDGWDSGDIRMDLDDATGRIGREQFFEEFIQNADIIFSTENLNKIEAGYGKGVREALEDMLYRIKTGRNKSTGQNKMVNALMNWVNGSVGSVMFFNMRSALLQQMSLVNYINFADNNIFAAAKAFANQTQYWADWAFIFNSDMLKQRRGGIMTDVNGAELAADMRKSKNPHRFLISKLLELGFLPTQIGDNIAIATGGATYYRNRINTYLKQGLSKKEAEAKAFTDFQDITQSTQQSARPDMVSQQQASMIGKIILNFQNVTSQFNRLGKKAFQDIYNRRITKPNSTQMQSDISNAARITYYFAVQNAIFYTLQTALFAMMFDDDEEDNNKLFLKKKERLINGSIDSVLRGTGITGAIISTLKNVAIAFARQRDVNYNPDESAVLIEALNFSPVIGIKARKISNAEKTLNYNKKVIQEMETFDIDNPQWSAVTNYIEGFTNAPLNRLYNKAMNMRQALNNQHTSWERTLMFLGWSQYNLNVKDERVEKKKEIAKESFKNKKSKEKFKDKEVEIQKQVQEEKKKKVKNPKCSAVTSSGKRCGNAVSKPGQKCTIHETVEKRKDGKKRQCRKRKSDGKRCKMMTSSKSQYCYYHD